MNAPRWLGLDLGGSSINVAVVENQIVIDRAIVAAESECGPETVIANLVAAAAAAIDATGPVAAIGVGVPGLFDADAGTIEMLPHLPGPWRAVPMTTPLREEFGVPATIINDARAFTLAEAHVGAAAGCSTVAAYVLGTGIGGGIVVDGRPHFGRHGRAGELAHQVVVPDGPPCGCGNRGCLEAVATSGVIAAAAGHPTALDAFAAASDGDRCAQDAIAAMIEHLGRAIANIVTVLVPERVVIGGGVAGAGDALFGPLRTAIARNVTLVPPDWYDVVPAVLGRDAGAIGAALWAAETTSLRP